MLSILTPTGDRPEAIQLLAKYIDRQTLTGPIEWVVVDDGKQPYDLELLQQSKAELKYVRRHEPNVSGGSLNRNMIVGLRHCAGDRIVIMEDDDWYAPTYLATYNELLNFHNLVGEGNARYYNVLHAMWRNCGNRNHASLAQTAFRREIIDVVDKCCRISSPFIDLKIWQLNVRKNLIHSHGLCVGLKSLPGRAGYGAGHRPCGRAWHRDDELLKLQEWIGKDVNNYRHWAVQRPEYVEIANDGKWLVMGKGPSFAKWPDIEKSRFDHVMTLNHAIDSNSFYVDIAHFLDIEAFRESFNWRRAQRVVTAWHPHENNQAQPKTLLHHIQEDSRLRELYNNWPDRRLEFYHASTGEKFRDRPKNEPVTGVKYFSSEAAINLLLDSGVKQIATIGIDGGTGYAKQFQHLPALRNGQPDFNKQFEQLHRAALKHKAVIYPALADEVPKEPGCYLTIPSAMKVA